MRLTPAKLAELYAFWLARKGGLEPVYFYDSHETNPRFTSDPTGATLSGRYTVRFDSAWSESAGQVRGHAEIVLIELT